MTNALAIYNQFDTLQRTAMALHRSNYFSDSKSEAQAVVKVMAGAELGLPPFASMTGIHIIQGKPALGANVIATLIKNDPRYNYKVMEHTDKVCKIQFYEDGEPCGVSEFTAQDAARADTKNMKKFPKNMLFARAISNGAKWYAAGVFGGSPVYTPEELGADVDGDGDIITGEIVEDAPEPGTWEDIEANSAKPNPPKREAITTPSINLPAWYDYVLTNETHYTHQAHINNALKMLGLQKPTTTEEGKAIYKKLVEHAAERKVQPVLVETQNSEAEKNAYN